MANAARPEHFLSDGYVRSGCTPRAGFASDDCRAVIDNDATEVFVQTNKGNVFARTHGRDCRFTLPLHRKFRSEIPTPR